MSKSTIIYHAGSSSNYQVKPFSSSYYNQNSYAEALKEVIMTEAASLYEKMVKDFTNETMTSAAACTNSNLIYSMKHIDEQLIIHKHH